MKHTSEWKYVRTNSKGEDIFRRDTNESLDDVLEYLKDKKERGGECVREKSTKVKGYARSYVPIHILSGLLYASA